jgi:hypothetical protein
MARLGIRDLLATAFAGVVSACLWYAYVFLSPSVERSVLSVFGRNFGGPNAPSVSSFHLAYEIVVALIVVGLVVLPVGLVIRQRPLRSCVQFMVVYLCMLVLPIVFTETLTDLRPALSLRSFWLFLAAGVVSLIVAWNLRLARREA